MRRPPNRITIGSAGMNAMFCWPATAGSHAYPSTAIPRYQPAS